MIFLHTGLYLSRRDRDFHVKKGGVAGLPEKDGGVAGSVNPIVDPLQKNANISKHNTVLFFVNF